MAAMDRIEVNPAICSGKPVIRGTRIMVRNILGMIAGGYTVDQIVTSYPELDREDVVAAWDKRRHGRHNLPVGAERSLHRHHLR